MGKRTRSGKARLRSNREVARTATRPLENGSHAVESQHPPGGAPPHLTGLTIGGGALLAIVLGLSWFHLLPVGESLLPPTRDLTSAPRLTFAIALAAACGWCLGAERDAAGKVAGLRTHIGIAVAMCALTFEGAHAFPGGDPWRLGAQALQAVGAIAAVGVFSAVDGTRVGVTTAASLLLSATVGLFCGAESYLGAIIVTAFAFADLWAVRGIRRWSRRLFAGSRPGPRPEVTAHRRSRRARRR